VDALQWELDATSLPSQQLRRLQESASRQIMLGLVLAPPFSAVRAVLQAERSRDLAAAEELLASCSPQEGQRFNTRRRIEYGALQAHLRLAQGRTQEALDALRQSLRLAAPGGALRLVADAGPAIRPLLETLLAEGVTPDYTSAVLDALKQSEGMTRLNRASHGALTGASAPAPIHETLTHREMDTLLLLAQRLTNKEIAARLHISPRTVQKHTIRIYQKLNVENRRQAAIRAQEMGLLKQG
jgi:LuxR family maltose regulon positive regulatory protein